MNIVLEPSEWYHWKTIGTVLATYQSIPMKRLLHLAFSHVKRILFARKVRNMRWIFRLIGAFFLCGVCFKGLVWIAFLLCAFCLDSLVSER